MPSQLVRQTSHLRCTSFSRKTVAAKRSIPHISDEFSRGYENAYNCGYVLCVFNAACLRSLVVCSCFALYLAITMLIIWLHTRLFHWFIFVLNSWSDEAKIAIEIWNNFCILWVRFGNNQICITWVESICFTFFRLQKLLMFVTKWVIWQKKNNKYTYFISHDNQRMNTI